MTIDQYLDGAPEPQKSTLGELRETLRRILPGAEETISYNMPAYKVKGKAVAGFAYFKNHCSFFPHSGSVLPELSDALEGYEWTKGTLMFGVDQPLPEDLVRRIVEVRMEQIGVA